MLKKALGIATAAVALLAVTTAPAAADEYWKPHHRSSGNAHSSNCYVPGVQGSMPMCLFWHNSGSQAVWAEEGSTYDLAGERFRAGTGSGSGQLVKNNATAMEVRYYQGVGGTVWFNSGYAGNWDYAYDGEGGPLYYTWNENASTMVGIGTRWSITL
ncbi:hypothetical protein M8Z33_15825 [Streptomyces sp. ZAF1911]|uniref:hypothetical protein n=1 Tax=Streptomyces sp. ZAF1911 TaxID=2944129 RepID=UPI00237B37C6|nr:hypothetical protein [Streptomyces sp. ZAF1911]MDD9378096.1 hypothetical protein [Streptomyces sp. ZAF1911]